MTKVVFCIPTVKRPHDKTLEALEKSVPLIVDRGYEEGLATEIGSAYISWARCNLIEKAMRNGADIIVFIDHDVSWKPHDLLKLIETPGDVVAGTYRFKTDAVEYMGKAYTDTDGRLITREDGCIKAQFAPAGFLKLTRQSVEIFAKQYPELTTYSKDSGKRHVDMFNHGVRDGIWYGEDYAFCRRWRETGNTVWLRPDLTISHHEADKDYPGNLKKFIENNGTIDAQAA